MWILTSYWSPLEVVQGTEASVRVRLISPGVVSWVGYPEALCLCRNDELGAETADDAAPPARLAGWLAGVASPKDATRSEGGLGAPDVKAAV